MKKILLEQTKNKIFLTTFNQYITTVQKVASNVIVITLEEPLP